MEPVNIHAAKTHLSKLLERVEKGEEVVLARAGVPIAKIVPLPQKRGRTPGSWRGRLVVPASFFEPLPEEEIHRWEA